MDVEVIRINMRGAIDTPAQDERILKELRRRRLLNKRHLYRGFRRRNLNRLLESGIDHDPRKRTYVSTREDLDGDSHTREENALEYALRGGCLAVYTEHLASDGIGHLVPPNIREHLVAVIVINW